jgi:molybdate transport system regulatory protein
MDEKKRVKDKATEPVAREHYRPEPGYMAKGKVWMEKEGEAYMGWGRVELLERISRFGSIAAAARSMGMSYRNAWLEVDEMNRLAPSPLVEKETGGVGGGHARVTREGQKIIAEYNELMSRFQEFLKRFA